MTITRTLIECALALPRQGRKGLPTGNGASSPPPLPPGRVPRIARLMALALRFEELLQEGEIKSYTHFARLGHVSRARISQIMRLTLLSPAIQEALLFLPRTLSGRDPIHLRQLLSVAAVLDWRQQMVLWKERSRKRCPANPKNHETCAFSGANSSSKPL